MPNKIPTSKKLTAESVEAGTVTDFAFFLISRMAIMMGMPPLILWDLMRKWYLEREKAREADFDDAPLKWSTEILKSED